MKLVHATSPHVFNWIQMAKDYQASLLSMSNCWKHPSFNQIVAASIVVLWSLDITVAHLPHENAIEEDVQKPTTIFLHWRRPLLKFCTTSHPPALHNLTIDHEGANGLNTNGFTHNQTWIAGTMSGGSLKTIEKGAASRTPISKKQKPHNRCQ